MPMSSMSSSGSVVCKTQDDVFVCLLLISPYPYLAYDSNAETLE